MAGDKARVDYERLAELLDALAYPARLELLEALRTPSTVGEIRLAPRRSTASDSPDRVASRQTVAGHLEKLLDTELVHRDPTGDMDDARVGPRYVVNAQKVYALTEDVRRLSVIHAGRGPAADETGTLAGLAAPRPVEGARLVLVHGAYEGKQFPLDARAAREGTWIVGRRRDVPIALDYDPWVSLENSIVAREGERYTLRDSDASKNGTYLNWNRLPPGLAVPLKPGDVVGVGRSLLVFAAG